MVEKRTCPHCGSNLRHGESCGCPGAVREERRARQIRERVGDEVHIRLDKMAGEETYYRNIRASGTTALINALAMLMLETASMIEQPIDKVYAVVATVLFAPDEEAV